MKLHTGAMMGILLLAGVATAQEWQVLFDGKSTEAFRGYKREDFPSKGWVIESGALKALEKGEHADIMTKNKFKNYELEFEWKTSPGGNSGVMYHVLETSGPSWHTGPECQVLDDDKHPDGKNPKTSAGSLYALIAPNGQKKLKPVGEWNTMKIVAQGKHIEHWLNGAKVVEYQWGSPEVKKLVAQSKFKDLPNFMGSTEGGYIVFQHHGQEVWYRNIRIRDLGGK